jgi:hypothetical protein
MKLFILILLLLGASGFATYSMAGCTTYTAYAKQTAAHAPKSAISPPPSDLTCTQICHSIGCTGPGKLDSVTLALGLEDLTQYGHPGIEEWTIHCVCSN